MQGKNRKHILQIVAASVMCLPTLCLVIFQATQRIFNMVSIGALLIAGIIMLGAISKKPAAKKPVDNTVTTSNEGVEKATTSNSNVKSKNIAAKIMAVVIAAVCLFLAWFSYKNMVTKYENFKLYEATVVAVKDTTKSDVDYDYASGTYEETTYLSCTVVFEYFDGVEQKTVVKVFPGVSNMPTKTIKIYVENDRVVATENVTIGGKFLCIGLIVLAILSLATTIFNFNMIYTGIGLLFTASLLVIAVPISVCPLSLLFVEYMPIIALLSPAGMFIYGVGISEWVHNRKQNKAN